MKVAIFGIQGQLGRDLESALAGFEIIPMLYEQVDVTRADQVEAAVAAAHPQWIINSAAMTHVDRCETEASEAFGVNALGALHVARASASVGARLLFVSTDYVFDGEKGAPYVENDPPRPINVYGVTKLAGEWFVRQACSEHYIVRTSGLYGLHPCWGKGTNFVETMLRLAAERDELRVVADEVLTPTFTEDLAAQIRRMMEAAPPFGVYHATNEGQCSWYEFAAEIFRLSGASVKLSPIASSQWKAAARRPSNSVLENAALKAASLNVFPEWKDALARYLHSRGRLHVRA